MNKPTTKAVTTRASSRLIRNALADIRSLPSTLIVKHARAFEMVILLFGFALGFYAIVTLLFVQPYVPVATTTDTVPTLDTDALDTLELWMEERQTATENPLRLTKPEVFDPIPATEVH